MLYAVLMNIIIIKGIFVMGGVRGKLLIATRKKCTFEEDIIPQHEPRPREMISVWVVYIGYRYMVCDMLRFQRICTYILVYT